jgi:enoyl-CoA hydratase/carnithine racemase
MYEEILYEAAGPVATITLNRPTKLNAWTMQMESEFTAAIRRAAAEDSIRAIIVTGAGRGFCAGADMSILNEAAANGPPQANLGEHQRRHSWLLQVPKPIIAAINGPCVGLGFVIALYCDLRLASIQAKFSTVFAKRGLVAEYGMAWMLPRLIGIGNALEILFSARTFDSQEALRLGLVNSVLPEDGFLAAAHAYAAELASSVSPRSLRIMKHQVYRSFDQTLDESVDLATKEMYGSFDTEDFREGVAHYLEKRPAAFTGK